MNASINDQEWEQIRLLPEIEMVELSIELDILVPEQINHRALINRCLNALIERLTETGLPLTQYDRDDIANLSERERSVVASLVGLHARKGAFSIDKIMKRGIKNTKVYQKSSRTESILLILPMLLPAVIRANLS